MLTLIPQDQDDTEHPLPIPSMFAAVVNGVAPMQGGKAYTIMVRMSPISKWKHGTTARSASEAMVCMNYIRRSRPDMGVKVVAPCT